MRIALPEHGAIELAGKLTDTDKRRLNGANMITNFDRRLGPARNDNGFACGSMGQRDVKIYCNEVSGVIESAVRTVPLRFLHCANYDSDIQRDWFEK